MPKEIPASLHLKPEDARNLLSAKVHIGAKNCSAGMSQYVYGRRPEGVHVINMEKTWEKLIFAVRVMANIENPADILAVSSRKYGQRAVLKFAKYTGAQAISGKFTPGTLTNCKARGYKEPRLIIVTDPVADAQVIRESAHVNVPVIALCDTDALLPNVDIAIPCSTKSVYSIGLMWYLLARELLCMRGSMMRSATWEIMPDMFFYRDLDAEKAIEAEKASNQVAPAAVASAVEAHDNEGDWRVAEGIENQDGWAVTDGSAPVVLNDQWATLEAEADQVVVA